MRCAGSPIWHTRSGRCGPKNDCTSATSSRNVGRPGIRHSPTAGGHSAISTGLPPRTRSWRTPTTRISPRYSSSLRASVPRRSCTTCLPIRTRCTMSSTSTLECAGTYASSCGNGCGAVTTHAHTGHGTRSGTPATTPGRCPHRADRRCAQRPAWAAPSSSGTALPLGPSHGQCRPAQSPSDPTRLNRPCSCCKGAAK